MRHHPAATEESDVMSDVANALQAVTALISERTRYEAWIAALATKTDVPAHVLEKVRTDYTGRLRGVLQSFTAHVPALQAALAEFQSRDAALAAQEQTSRDEHAEGELRHMVGEFDAEQWDKVRIGHEALLSRLAGERQGIAAELAEVQRSLEAAADASNRAAAIVGTPTPAATAIRDDAPTPAVQAAMREVGVVEAPVVPTPGVGAPVVSTPVASAPVALPIEPLPTPIEVVDRRSQIDDLGFLRGSPRPAVRETPGAQPGAPISGTATKSPETPILRIVPDTPTAPVKATTADAAKTLKCAECGQMNYATEWYCERCGGELAVL
jgi:hypothetical protein